MRRKIFTLCSGVSLLLCMAACVLWVRSYWFHNHLHRSHWTIVESAGSSTTVEEYLDLHSAGGGAMMVVSGIRTTRPRTPEQLEESRRRNPEYYGKGRLRWEGRQLPFKQPMELKGGLLGFGYQSTVDRGGAQWSRALRAPWAAIAACFAAAPGIQLLNFLRARKRRKPGHCAVCGYDLRASLGRCPECGSVTPGAEAVAV